MMNGKASHLTITKPTKETRRKIHRTSLPFHPIDFILNEKQRRLLTIMNDKSNVMPRQAQ